MSCHHCIQMCAFNCDTLMQVHNHSVCVASIVRIVMMDKLVKAQDFTWAMCQVFIWSCVEPFTGIICACLPTYAPFLRRCLSRQKHGTDRDPQYRVADGYKMGSGASKREWNKIRGHSDASRAAENPFELTGTSTVNVYSNTNDTHCPETIRTAPYGSDGGSIMVTKDISLARSV